MYPNHSPFKTYRRGSSVIDFVLAPPEIADRVTNFVYEPFLYRLKGDHRAYYFDISETVLFGDTKEQPFDPKGRGLYSNDVKNAKIYLEKVHKCLVAKNVRVRLSRLLSNPHPDHYEVERIDTIITKACEAGEDACRRRRRTYWSVTLHTIKRELSIWCIFKSWKRRNLRTNCIISKAKSLGIIIANHYPIGTINATIKKLPEQLKIIH